MRTAYSKGIDEVLKTPEEIETEERRRKMKDKYEIVDITFAEQSNFEAEILLKMFPIY